MNFLAHLVLGPQTPEGRVGSIAPDLIRGPLPADLHPKVFAAAVEHQQIDRVTDTHRAFHATRDRLSVYLDKRFAGILADVVYDHVLASGWSLWFDQRLYEFIAQAERMLSDHDDLMPGRMRWVVQRMIREGWLASYATLEGLQARLGTMSRRLTQRTGREIDLVLPATHFEAVLPGIQEDFASLWPDLVRYVATSRRSADVSYMAS